MLSRAEATRRESSRAPFARAACLLAALVLAACEGGGSGDGRAGGGDADRGDGSDGETPQVTTESVAPAATDHGPFDDLARRALDGYAGERADSALDADAAGAFAETLLLGALAAAPAGAQEGAGRGFAVSPRASRGAVAALVDALLSSARETGDTALASAGPSTSVTCRGGGGGVLIARESGSGRHLRLELDACVEPTLPVETDGEGLSASGTVVFDGAIEILRADDAASGTSAVHLGYDALRVAFGAREVELTGAESWPQGIVCDDSTRARLSDLLVRDTGSGEAVLFENLRSAPLGIGSVCTEALAREANWFAGRVLHSRHGAVTVATPTYLRWLAPGRAVRERLGQHTTEIEVAQPERDPADPSRRLGGELALAGADARALRVTLARETLAASFHPAPREPRDVVVVEATLAEEGRVETVVRVSAEALEGGALATLADADADGLPDGWERRYGLDPGSAQDAASDGDGDGLAALGEYAALAAPDDPDDRGLDPDDFGLEVRLPGWHGPHAALALEAAGAYTGRTEDSTLDADAAGVFAQTLLLGALAEPVDGVGLDERDYPLSMRATRGMTAGVLRWALDRARGAVADEPVLECAGGGGADVTRTAEGALELVFDACVDPQQPRPGAAPKALSTLVGLAFDGRLAVAPARDERSDRPMLHVGFDRLRVANDARDFVLLGAETLSGDPFCRAGAERESYVLLRDEGSGETVLFENLRAAQQGLGARCLDAAPRDANRFDGRLLHSAHGAVTVATPTPLRWFLGAGGLIEIERPASDPLDPERPLDGEIVLGGADARALRLRYEARPLAIVTDPMRYAVGARAVVDATLVDGEAIGPSARVTDTALREGALATLADADLDGLPDGWERRYGLDPDAATDATMDADGDGRSAAAEYVALTAPDRAAGIGLGHDEGLALRVVAESFDSVSSRGRVTLELESRLASDHVEVRRSYVTLRVVRGGSFAPYLSDHRCVALEGGTTLRCTLEAPWQRAAGAAFAPTRVVVDVDDDALELVAELAESPLDEQPDNDRAALLHRFEGPPVDFAIDVADIAVVAADATRTLVATVQQRAEAAATDVEIGAALPFGLSLESATLLSDGDQAVRDRCELGPALRCAIERVGADDTLTLRLAYRGVVEADAAIDWYVSGARVDANPDNDVATTRLLPAAPVTTLQALIDAAADGDTVELPPGVYLGALDGRGKRLHLRGASGAEPTLIVSDDAFAPALSAPGAGSLYEHLVFRAAGTAIERGAGAALTVANSVFEPSAAATQAVGPLIDGPGALRFVNNRVEGFGGAGGRCGHLFRHAGADALRVEHSLFVGNDCDALILAASDAALAAADAQGLTVVNNTFVDNARLLRVDGSVGHALRVENNIVVGTERLLVEGPDAGFGANGSLTTNANLLFDSERESILSGALASRPGFLYGAPDLSFDPLFVDPAAGDYRLSAASAAIDGGVPPTPWTPPDEGGGATLGFVFDDEVDAVDGLGDGVPVPDLGAFEYRP